MYLNVFILLVFALLGSVRPKENIKGNARSTTGEAAAKHQDFPCRECDYIVKGYHNPNAQFVGPGKVICLDAAMKYQNVVLKNIHGSPEEPIIIRNCGGVAKIMSTGAFGLKIEESSNFKILGDGAADSTFGIKISTTGGFFLTLEKFTTDFEVAWVEVAGYNKDGLGEKAGFAGFGIKTSPYQDCALFSDSTRQAWVMRNVSIHNNYIHDTGGEGMYIGHGFYKGRKEPKCESMTYSHSIKGLRVHHNLVENTGFDGIQIKNADEDVEVYNNTIRNYGTRNNNTQNEGLFIGEGVTGKMYNNLIDTGTGNGIQFQGMGNNEFYNNLVLNAGEDGFNCSGSSMGVYIPDGYFKIFNNTIYNSREDGFVFFHNHGGPKIVKNNLVVKAGQKITSRGAILDSSNNIMTQNEDRIKFLDPKHADFRLAKGSPAINKGADVRKFHCDLLFDFNKSPRPKGLHYDIGAFESD
jgi:hypothetical protein